MSNQLKVLIPADKYKSIEALYRGIKKDDELEFLFCTKSEIRDKLGQEKYMNVLRYIKGLAESKKLKVSEPTKVLDINYIDKDNLYRMTIKDTKYIDRFIQRTYNFPNKNFIIVKYLLSSLAKAKNTDNYGFILKHKNKDSTVDVLDVNLRVRLSKEEDLMDRLKDKAFLQKLMDTLSYDRNKNINNNIVFRYKERISLYLDDQDANNYTRIDVTYVKTCKNIYDINKANPEYELEIETKETKKGPDRLGMMFEYAEKLTKILQQTNFIINHTLQDKVVDKYKFLLSLNQESTNLISRQPLSLEVYHMTDVLADKYAVTDKPDGARYFMIIHDGGVYLIGSNLDVRDTGIVLSKKDAEKYNDTILDGEYVLINQHNRYLYLVFDCLRVGDQDIRKEPSLLKRLDRADEVINSIFVIGKQKGHKFKSYKFDKEFDLKQIVEFHKTEISKYMESINSDMKIDKKYPLVRRKYFIDCLGAVRWEIFKYSALMWQLYVSDNTIACPYSLDGLIFHPLNQSYITNVEESNLSEYKWKPPESNSIDFYIRFKKNDQTGKILTIYDNSNEKFLRNKTYRICSLYVGKNVRGKEFPHPFKDDENLHEAYLFTDNNEVRDLNGDIVMDDTVVEFYYNNEASIPPKFRWVPIRTRFDKTECVRRMGKKYGNYSEVANKIWRSISNPILMSDFEELGKGNVGSNTFFDNRMKALSERIEHSTIVTSAKENKYYQVQKRIIRPMREFHNWIKSNIIYTHCHFMYQNKKQLSVLDIGCGRGGDNMKFYYTTVEFYVGLDLDYDNISSPINGAISRYNQMRKTHPNFPKMYFILADAGAILDPEDQSRAVARMSEDNRKMIQKFFNKDPKKRTYFDRVNCQFAIHYFLKDPTYWSNFKENLNMYLRKEGYIMITAMDGDVVRDLLKDKERYTVHYTDKDGEDKLLFDIVKKYDDNSKSKLGNAIDFHASWMFLQGNYMTEYLVERNFLIDELDRDCDMELVDTGMFSEQFEIHRQYFKEYFKYEEIDKTRQFLEKVSEYYEDDDINRSSRKFTQLNRFYIFRKREGKRQRGGGKKGDEFVVNNMTDYNKRYSYISSIHNILAHHRMIPKTVRIGELMSDLNLGMVSDMDMTATEQRAISDSLVINHEIEDGDSVRPEKVLDRLDVYILERDCDDTYNVVETIDTGAKQCAVLIRDGDLYRPVYKRDDKLVGIFDKSKKILRQINSYLSS